LFIMDSIFGTDEEDDMLGGSLDLNQGNSNLDSLFGAPSAANKKALVFTAPKKPGKNPPKPKPEVKQQPSPNPGLFASVVAAYRYTSGKNEGVGKLGIAVLKDVAKRDFKILLYLSKQKPVTQAQIHPQLTLNVQGKNCSGFYDDRRQYWTVVFDNENLLFEFSKQVAICKFYSNPASNQLVSVDMRAKNKENTTTVNTGDNCEVKYTGWLLQPNTASCGQIFDSNVNKDKMFRFKVGQGKVIKAWELGVVGMEKSMVRFLVVPPNLAYGQNGFKKVIPPNSSLAFQIELIRMKQSRERSSTTNSVENNQNNIVGGIQMPSNTPVSSIQMPNNNTQIGGIEMPNNTLVSNIQMPNNSIELPISSLQNTPTTTVANNNINLPVSTIQDTSNRNSSIMSRIQNIGTPMMLPINQQQNNQINNQIVASSSSLTSFATTQSSFLLDQQQPISVQNSVQQPISVHTAQQPIMHAMQQPMNNQNSLQQPMSVQSSFNQPMSIQSSYNQPMSRPEIQE